MSNDQEEGPKVFERSPGSNNICPCPIRKDGRERESHWIAGADDLQQGSQVRIPLSPMPDSNRHHFANTRGKGASAAHALIF